MTARELPVDPPRPPFFWRLTDFQWLMLDVIVAFASFVAVIFNLHPPHSAGSATPSGIVAMIFLGLGTLPIAVRRFWPLPVLGVVTLAIAVLTSIGKSPFALDVTIGLASYMVANRFDRRLSVMALVIVEVAIGVSVVVAAVRDVAGPYVIHSLLIVGALWFIGDSVRARRQYVAGLAEQAEQRRVTETERARQAVRDERVRIPRELHDVAAHSLTVMTVQAGVGRRVGQQRPDEARRALEAIETVGRTAQDEVRLILGLLRDDEPERLALTPAPSLTDLAPLVEKMCTAGVPVELHVSGSERPLPATVELSLYRIVQEALTNVVKHAGKAQTTVQVAFGRDQVRIEVVNDCRGEAL